MRPRRSCRSLLRLLLLATVLAPVAAPVPADARGRSVPMPPSHPAPVPPSTDVYPTDLCVAEKLRAAARYCAASLGARSTPVHRGRGKHGRGDARKVHGGDVAAARRVLSEAWDRAEATSAAAGVSCEDTTVSAEEMIALLDDGAEALLDEGFDHPRVCRTRRVVHAANACRALLDAESLHLLERDRDRDRRRLERRRARALTRFERSWSKGCSADPPAPTEAVAALVERAFLATVVSPAVSTEWTLIEPPAQVPYGDRVLEPICSRGTPWVYFAKRGTVNKLIVYFQGGGACWNALTCGFLPVFKATAGPGDNPANATSGFGDFANPENPFRDWNAVFVPYCTGDVHWGDAFVQHAPDGSVPIHHKGRVNAAVAEKFAREHFVNPDQVFVTGSSAGSYGAVVNALYLQEDAYPSTPFAVLGDGGNGVITEAFLQNDLAKWGIENNLPSWIPGLDKPLTELEASDLWTEAALYYPGSRFANYSTAYDGGTGGQVGFYNIMRSGPDLAAWLQWWRPSCEWNQEMRRLVQQSADQAPANYRYYIGAGSRHTMWGHDKVYTDTTGGVPTIVSWVRAMLDGTPDWTNVECSDCGQLLPGDPRPDPPQLPYVLDPGTGQQRIVCK